ncbi:MAG: hypothetical protein JNG84_02405 [Archangium sp.]|nr:hypothetical protein [Archangium sp.]
MEDADGGWQQQGPKLVSTDAVGAPRQGWSVALSADGNTAALGGYLDNGRIGAAWVFARDAGVWSQQGPKLVGTGASWPEPQQGSSVALSADGNTLLSGAPLDGRAAPGAAWVFVRTGGAWSQQGSKLAPVNTSSGSIYAGRPVALSADGRVAALGGYYDSAGVGAAWVFTRNDGAWTERTKLVGTGAIGLANQGGASLALDATGTLVASGSTKHDTDLGTAWLFASGLDGGWSQTGGPLAASGTTAPSELASSLSLNADGTLLAVGAPRDNTRHGGTWLFQRTGDTWTQWGTTLFGAGASMPSSQGSSVALSSDGRTLVIGGPADEDSGGSVWVFTR